LQTYIFNSLSGRRAFSKIKHGKIVAICKKSSYFLPTSVSSFIARYQRIGSIDDVQQSGRKLVLSEDVSFIDEKMKANDELTSGEIQKLL
jgi:hypothetical protein